MPTWMDNGSNAPRPKDTERDLMAKIADTLVAQNGLAGPSYLASAVPRPTDDKRELLAKWLAQLQA